jgi:hypothetical protein
MLRRLAWSSVPSPRFSVAHLVEIVAHSRRYNERHHVSGKLLFTGAHFLGILEGHECDLENLWRRLQRDERHRELIRIGSERCGMRWFPQWSLGYRNHAVVRSHLLRLRSPAAILESKWMEMTRSMMLPPDSIQTRLRTQVSASCATTESGTLSTLPSRMSQAALDFDVALTPP